MTTIVEWHKVAGAHLAQDLKNAQDKLGSADGEVLLDFSDVQRIDPAGLLAVEDFASVADQKSVRVVMCGVNVSVYKVLKLARLTPRFSFVN